jgi:hypothetical protein
MGEVLAVQSKRGIEGGIQMNLQLVPKLQTPERPAHLIRVAVPRLNKCDHISEYLEQLETRDYDLNWAEVIETRQLNCAEWNELMQNLLTDRDWLAGKGGASSWAVSFGDSRDGWLELSEPERELFRATSYLYVIAVIAPTGQTIYIDPEGYNYARYVAFAAEGMPEGMTRAERERARARAESDKRTEELKARIAAPAPEVPPDHGIRFLWNGLKVHGSPLFNCSYSQGELLHYPKGTITVYANHYKSFPDEVLKYFHVENNSDVQSDYFDDDKIRVMENHPLYAAVKGAFDAQEAHRATVNAKREARWRGQS